MPSPLLPPSSSNPVPGPSLGTILLTRAWVFQIIIASPILFFLGGCAFFSIFDGYTRIYWFVYYLGNAILASAIVFIVLVQRQLRPEVFLQTAKGRRLTFWFETAKAVLGTGVWLWIFLDAMFGPSYWSHYRERRVACAAIAYLVLILFWYPAVGYAYYAMKDDPSDDDDEEEVEGGQGEGERTPLLGGETV